MALKQVVGATMAVTMGVIILFMILPTLTTVKNSVWKTLPNQNDTTNQQLMLIGDNVYLMLAFITVGVVGFVVLLYASNRDPFDINTS